MEDADFPPTQPSGSLIPPTKVPGTALATATPPPPQRRASHDTLARGGFFRRLLRLTLDSVDEFADNVAVGLGLRNR